MQTSKTTQASWEYLMPKRKERMAGYIRESDPTLADSTTIESQAKAVREYGEKEGYIYEPQYEYREAISAYLVSYIERPQLMRLLEAAKRKEFDVLVVSEVRAISRKQVEVLVIYDLLQKYGIRLETVKEKFGDDAMSKAILSLRAMFVEIEREQMFMRLQRGKADRMTIGKAPNGHPYPAYGYILVDTPEEVKGRYAFNHAVVYVDAEGKEWSEYTVVLYIVSLIKEHYSLRSIAAKLTDMGIPPPHRSKGRKLVPHWDSSALTRILQNPIYIGEVWGNRFKKVGKNMVKRPRDEWVRIGDAPAIIDKEMFVAIQKQLAINKQDALRNNRHGDEIGLLRSGFIFCGICGRKMCVTYPPARKTGDSPSYRCYQKTGNNHACNHITVIHVPHLDKAAWEKVLEVLCQPELVRARIAKLREIAAPVIDVDIVEKTIATIQTQMDNLYELAKHASHQHTISQLGQMMEDLERQRRAAESLLYDSAEEDEAQADLEAEIARFEQWTDNVSVSFLDPSYTPSYEEKRLAIRVLGLQVTVYPSQGNYPYRYQIAVTVPEITAKIKHITLQSRDEWHSHHPI